MFCTRLANGGLFPTGDPIVPFVISPRFECLNKRTHTHTHTHTHKLVNTGKPPLHAVLWGLSIVLSFVILLPNTPWLCARKRYGDIKMSPQLRWSHTSATSYFCDCQSTHTHTHNSALYYPCCSAASRHVYLPLFSSAAGLVGHVLFCSGNRLFSFQFFLALR